MDSSDTVPNLHIRKLQIKMNIQLKKLTLTNFKGIRSLEVDFSKETTISGRNASGKTTVFDSFAWLLFGKNSQDKKDFEVKTLDANNQPIHKLDHEVEAVLDVDGMTTTIKRVFREKWVKPKGQADEVFSGHETTLFWNDVPVSQADFKVKIDSLCSEEVFKMITNPYGFTSLHWKEQREVLFRIAGDVSDADILDKMATLQNKSEIVNLTNVLNQSKSFDEFKKELAAKKKKLNDELKLIPARIDETNRSMPDSVNTAAIEKEIAGLNAEIDKIEEQIADRSKVNESVLKEREEKQKQIYALRANIVELEDRDARELREANRGVEDERERVKSEKERLERELNSFTGKIKTNCDEIIDLNTQITSLRNQWNDLNEKEVTFEEGIVACPTCHREYPSDDVEAKKEELRANFNIEKQKNLEEISTKGKAKKEALDKLKAENEELEKDLGKVEVELDAIRKNYGNLYQPLNETKKDFQPNPEISKLKEQIKAIQEELDAPQQDTNADLTEKRTGIRSQIDELKNKLSVKDQIERAKARIKELEGQAKTMGQEVADLERMEFTMAEFTKKKIETIEDKINAKFPTITWKLYRELINKGEEECCECLINGVPYSDLNTGSKMIAGLEIINALGDYYNTYAPCFLDNRESCQVIPEMKCQVINLVVTEDEKLTIKHG